MDGCGCVVELREELRHDPVHDATWTTARLRRQSSRRAYSVERQTYEKNEPRGKKLKCVETPRCRKADPNPRQCRSGQSEILGDGERGETSAGGDEKEITRERSAFAKRSGGATGVAAAAAGGGEGVLGGAVFWVKIPEFWIQSLVVPSQPD